MSVESSKYKLWRLRGTRARSTHMEPSSDEGWEPQEISKIKIKDRKLWRETRAQREQENPTGKSNKSRTWRRQCCERQRLGEPRRKCSVASTAAYMYQPQQLRHCIGLKVFWRLYPFLKQGKIQTSGQQHPIRWRDCGKSRELGNSHGALWCCLILQLSITFQKANLTIKSVHHFLHDSRFIIHVNKASFIPGLN